MVLHLLGKKSWNVYNSENVERVRRDEAEAKAREEAEEQRMQEVDAARRTAILRGDKVPPLPQSPEESEQAVGRLRKCNDGLPRKRRRLRGEDDTDRAIRYAREDVITGEKARIALVKRKDEDVPLHDHAGHVQLIPAPDEKAIRKAEKNAEVEAEKTKKRKREEDQYTMRFSNAAGFKNGLAKPWYAVSRTTTSNDGAQVLANVEDKDVWGNEDPLRKERERSRMSSSDPVAAMQQAQKQLKQSEQEKEKYKKERMAEIKELKQAEEHRQRHEKKRHNRSDDEYSLDGFSLDAPADAGRGSINHDRHHKRRHRRQCERSQSGNRSRWS